MMKPSKRMYRYACEHFNEVMHTTLNPEGPGVVRIHLVPPVYSKKEIAPSVAIINGQDIVPVGTSWAILLCEFIREVNEYSGKPISENDMEEIMERTIACVKKVFPLISKKRMKNDLYRIFHTFMQVAHGEEVDEPIGYISMGEYASFMKAPHRMDLMVSAMTKDGKWHCNQKCVHCYAAGQTLSSERECSTEEWKDILDRCREAMIPQVTFTGGEPTMREDLIELIDHAKWFVTRLNTNGIRLTPEFCRQLYNASLDSIQITFYSCDQEIHNTLVGAQQFEKTDAGIDNALAANLSVSVNTPLCTLNRDYVKTLKYLHDKGVLYVTCSGLITTGNARTENSENLQLTREEIRSILKDAVEYCYENGMEISFTSPGWVEKEFFEEIGINTPTCGAALSNMAVTPAGNVVPCQSWLSGKPLGNMLQDPWETIWNAPETVMRRKYSASMIGECPLRVHRGREDRDHDEVSGVLEKKEERDE